MITLSGHAEDRYPVFNVRVGTQTFGPKYAFSTTETQLVETARCIHEMGSDIIKFRLADKQSSEARARRQPRLGSLAEIARRDPSCRHVLDMPFRYYLLWAYPVRPKGEEHPWRNGLSAEDAAIEHKQIYDLTRYLLRTYDGTGKTFLLGHWEGDWSLLGHYDAAKDPADVSVQGMTDWYKVRQRAVEEARRDEPHHDVQVLHYSEVNLVAKAVEGAKSVTNSVLPHVAVDMISYSSYDGLGKPFPDKLVRCLDYLQSKARITSVGAALSRSVFIGEYGFPLLGRARTPEQQGQQTRELIKAAAGWGCPFVLYWEMYDNESGDATKGFWLIDNHNRKQPAWFVHQAFFARAHTFKNLYRFWLGRNPDEQAFSDFARSYDSFRTSAQLDALLASPEYAQRVSNEQFARLVSSSLLPPGATRNAADRRALAQLDAGTSRPAVLDALLDSPEFARQTPDAQFVRDLLRNALGRRRVDARSAELRQMIERLTQGVKRSVLWRELLDSDAFCLAELPIRDVDAKRSPVVARKHFFLHGI